MHLCFFVCPHLFFSISTPVCSVNKVHSLVGLGEICVSVSILIQSISMGSMSYSVCCFSLYVCVCVCVWDGYLNTCVFVPFLFENPQAITICECLHLAVRACMCVCMSVCVWGTVFPGLLVIMFLGVMGGTWKPCAAQIKTNKEMMGAPLSPLWPGGPRGARAGDWAGRKGGGKKGERER